MTLPADGLYAPGLAVDARNVTGLSAMFSVLEGEISSKVSNGDFSSYVTQTAKEFEVVAKEINLKADKTTVDGLLTVNGQIRADKIDTDSLVVKNLDTRYGGSGVVIKKGAEAINIYNGFDSESAIRISTGKTTPGGSESAVAGVRVRDEHQSSELTSTGLVLYNSDGSVYANFNRLNGLTLPPYTKVDMPGCLMGGSINGVYGSLIDCWGKTFKTERMSLGKYKITHKLKHTRYFVTANLASDGGFKGGVIVIEKKTDYVVLATYGLDNGFHDVDLEFIICGQN